MKNFILVFQGMEVEEVPNVEELILAKAQLKTMDDGYQDLKLETPEWILDKLAETSREINNRVQGELQRRLRNAKARRSALRTADEKRKDLDDEIAALESKLG